MKFKFKLLPQLTSLTLLSCVSTFAFAVPAPVLCPSAELIKNSYRMLETVSQIGGDAHKFMVWSLEGIKDTTYLWHITTYVDATDFNQAIKIGKNNVKNITMLKHPNAYDMKDAYVCAYDSPNSRMGVGAVAFKDEQQKFKIASLDMKSLL